MLLPGSNHTSHHVLSQLCPVFRKCPANMFKKVDQTRFHLSLRCRRATADIVQHICVRWIGAEACKVVRVRHRCAWRMLRRACVRRFDVELLGCSIPSLASSGCLAVLELLRHTTPHNSNTTTFRRCSSTLDSVGQHRAEQRRSRRLDITSHCITSAQ